MSKTRNRRSTIISWCVPCLGFLFGWTVLTSVYPSYGFGARGTNDFIEFWSAYQLFEPNSNPYDPDELNIQQRFLGRDQATPLRLWNPPWALTLLSPVLEFDFPLSAKLFFAGNMFLLFASAILIWRLVDPAPRIIPLVALTMAFLPTLDCLNVGQISIVLLAALVAMLFCLERRLDIPAGFCAAILTIKVHLFFLLLLTLAWWIARNGRWRVAVGGIAGLALLLSVTIIHSEAAIPQWVDSFQNPPFHWIVASLVGLVRQIILALTGAWVAWPVVVVPTLATWGVGLWLLTRRPHIDWRYHGPTLVGLSVIFSPYGWLFDQSVLLPLHILPLAYIFGGRIPANRRIAFLLLIVIMQILAMSMYHLYESSNHHYVWLPPSLLGAWLLFWGSDRPAINDAVQS
ncbi:MAG: DUF2029 domain-containing protein [Bdellovibrionales bacterium]|nr:DUF2029 domain-containing protein [Bdellovibrionales bacterium]